MRWCPWRFVLTIPLLLHSPAIPGELFDRFTVEDGLSHNHINALAQDSLGFLWIATPDGLTRFDGYSFVQYRHDFSDSSSLPANYVGTVYVDRSGSLWAGTFDGVCRYDPGRDGFVRYPINAEFQGGSDVNTVLAIHQFNDSTLWFATSRGLLQLTKGQHALLPLIRPDHQPYRMQAASFTQDPWTGRMWIGLYSGGLVVYDGATARALALKFSSPQERLLTRSRITSIVPDSTDANERILWVSTIGDGLFKLNLSGEWNDSIRVTHLTQPRTETFPLHILSFARDRRGAFWAGTAEEGFMELLLSNGEMNKASEYRHNSRLVRTLSNNTVTAILEDHSGNIWAGTSAGLNKMVSRRGEFHHVRPPGLLSSLEQESSPQWGVTCLFQDSRGKVWVGTQPGRVFSFDPNRSKDGGFAASKLNNILKLGFSVTAIYEIRNRPGTIWVGTYGNGLYRWEIASGAIFHLKNSPAKTSTLSSNAINCLVDDDQGKLWIGTDNGFNMLDPVSLEVTRFVYAPAVGSFDDSTRLLSNVIWTIVPDRNALSPGLWIGTVGGWLSRFDLHSRSFRHFTNSTTPALTNRTVASLLCDSSGTLWIGTYSGGLKRLDPSRQSIRDYTMRDGLANNMVQGILQGSRGTLWLSTNNGLCRFDKASGNVITFEQHDGLQSNQFYRNACISDETGALLFGGPNGFNRFHPDNIALNTHPPRVMLSHVQLLGTSRSIIRSLAGESSIELGHSDNSLSFEFVGIDLTNSKRNRYAYMLIGADDSWIQSGTRRNATYANLSPGEYRFHVKSANNDGIWNETGAVLSISVLPPYWQTWWFLCGVGVLCLVMIVATYRFRVRGQIQRRLEIERIKEEESEKVRIKTARDFHDEMGHRLTRINMLSETASRKLEQSPTEVKDLLDAIRDNANHLFNGTRDFIWSLDSRNDSLFDFAVRLKDFGDELFYMTGVAFQARGIAEDFHSIHLSMEMRRQLMLIFKEAMTNAVRHASCKSVDLEFQVANQSLQVSFSDDGKGFSVGEKESGTGISNMRARASKISGSLTMDSGASTGTRVLFLGTVKRD